MLNIEAFVLFVDIRVFSQKYFYPFLAGPPTGPPIDVVVQHRTMRMVKISWKTLPEYYAIGGEPYKYKAIVWADTGFYSSRKSIKGLYLIEGLSFKATELEVNTTYCASLMTFGSLGDGPWGNCVHFTTASGIIIRSAW